MNELEMRARARELLAAEWDKAGTPENDNVAAWVRSGSADNSQGMAAIITALSQQPSAVDHTFCGFSTGICGAMTAGTGALDANGYWQYPCTECTLRANLAETQRQLEELQQAAGVPDGWVIVPIPALDLLFESSGHNDDLTLAERTQYNDTLMYVWDTLAAAPKKAGGES